METITDNQLEFINKVSELIRDVADTGVDYVTYKQVGDIDRLKDKLVEHHNLQHQSYFSNHSNKNERAWHSDYVRHDHPKAWKDEDAKDDN